jgi:predicted nucleic acid-binding protein
LRNYFFDTSAFVRAYSFEPGSRRVQDMLRSAVVEPPASRVVVSEFILPETSSALLQIARGPHAARRGLSKSALRLAYVKLDEQLGPRSEFIVLGLSGLMHDAVALVRKHGLRASDAVQLASALFASRSVQRPEEFYFVCCDNPLAVAAEAEGLEVIDPTV